MCMVCLIQVLVFSFVSIFSYGMRAHVLAFHCSSKSHSVIFTEVIVMRSDLQSKGFRSLKFSHWIHFWSVCPVILLLKKNTDMIQSTQLGSSL